MIIKSILGEHRLAPMHPPARQWTDGPDGHRADPHYRETGFGCLDAQTHLPHNGTPNFVFPSSQHILSSIPHHVGRTAFGSTHAPNLGSLSKLHFLAFDGDNPDLWISMSEDYCDIYHIDPSMWIHIVVMHFTCPAVRWCQSVEKRFKGTIWREFDTWSLERFG
jgi:hypothetical protein